MQYEKTAFDVFFLILLHSATLILGRSATCFAAAHDIPMEGAVYHVHRPDGSHKTYLDIVIGRAFEGKRPNDITSIKVAGPDGPLSIGKEDFNCNPRWRGFWVVLPGVPKIGRYSFEVAGRDCRGFASDTQKINRTVPLPIASGFKEHPSCPSPVFSWPRMDDTIPLYYQLEIRDMNRKHLFRTGFIRDMSEVRIPPDILKPGTRFQWRVRVADGEDWIAPDNRSQSRWVTSSRSRTLKP